MIYLRVLKCGTSTNGPVWALLGLCAIEHSFGSMLRVLLWRRGQSPEINLDIDISKPRAMISSVGRQMFFFPRSISLM